MNLISINKDFLYKPSRPLLETACAAEPVVLNSSLNNFDPAYPLPSSPRNGLSRVSTPEEMRHILFFKFF